MTQIPISHAFVLPDPDFFDWLLALEPYRDAFPRVAVVRSPRGNDLNRYRNVSAVTASRTWMRDDPLLHIRTVYPSVVRVDVVQARTPDELSAVVARRVQADDRFGVGFNGGQHIHDRFVLGWPTAHRPIRMTYPFGAQGAMGLGIASSAGVQVLAGADGVVTTVSGPGVPNPLLVGDFVTVRSIVGGKTYLTTYGGLRGVNVAVNQRVRAGDLVGWAMGDSFPLIVQYPAGGLSGYVMPDVIDPTDLIYVDGLRIRPTVEGLRVRTLPNTDATQIDSIDPWHQVELREMHGRALAKIGRQGEWIRVRTPVGRQGYSAAWYLRAVIAGEGLPFPAVNSVGVNLDALHPLGTPQPDQLGNLGWVRLNYIVSRGDGSQDIGRAYDTYAPLAEQYAQAGIKVLFVATHQVYGEAAGFPAWPQMRAADWARLIPRYADLMSRIARQWAGTGFVGAWQIWNEQDTPPHLAVAAAPIPTLHYGDMLARAMSAIRSADATVRVITGGHVSGPGAGTNYARAALSRLPDGLTPDGIAFHPYGRGPDPRPPYAIFGHIDDSVRAYAGVLPDTPLWITEWGVLDRPTDAPQDIANYATNFVSYLKSRYADRIAAIIWYAWAEGMHNGYGLVDAQGQPRPPLTSRFLSA